jgi:hypothetical protein
LDALASAYQSSFAQEVGASQRNAWSDQLRTLQRELEILANAQPDALRWSIIFEYELPRERGRRPDVILLAGAEIVVLEFKGARSTTRVAVDQLQAYARDIREYHAASHYRNVRSVLVLGQGDEKPAEFEDIRIVFRQDLGTSLALLKDANESIDLHEWLSAAYSPLPSLVTAARRIFEHEPLPAIRRAQSAGINDALEALQRAATMANHQGERHLALLTGVPGSGKTLVGLQFVYATRNDAGNGEQDAIFLSGNGPLVTVLQHALENKIFVRDVHGFLKQHGGSRRKTPGEHIWVYDEAQRAWDEERVKETRKDGFSEPEDFVRLGDRMSDWALVVGLIGEGQEINRGEESGLIQWNHALSKTPASWKVHCPDRLSYLFSNVKDVIIDDALDLTSSLRSHLAEDIPKLISCLLTGQLEHASVLSRQIADQGFDAYVTRDLELAKRYLRERYEGQTSMRYGYLASSKARNLDKYNIKNEFHFSKRVKIGPWFNDPPDSVDSCCQFREVATEFACQGLELDFPLVCWGDDLWWDDGWKTKESKRAKAKNPHQLRINSYRVLLSRGRDGFIVWVPREVALDPTYEALLQAGLPELK